MTRRRTLNVLTACIPYAVALAAALTLWALLVVSGMVDRLLLPSIGAVTTQLGEVLSDRETFVAIAVTTREIFVSFLLASVIGVLVGMVIGAVPLLRAAFTPTLSYAYAIPLVVFYPLFIVAFGLGEASKIAFGTCAAVLPIAIATAAGAASTDRTLLMAARAMGARRLSNLRIVVVPSAFGDIITGLQLGLVFAILAVVGGEFIGGTAGLGYLLATAGQSLHTDQVFAYVIVTLGLAVAINGCMAILTHLTQRRFAS